MYWLLTHNMLKLENHYIYDNKLEFNQFSLLRHHRSPQISTGVKPHWPLTSILGTCMVLFPWGLLSITGDAAITILWPSEVPHYRFGQWFDADCSISRLNASLCASPWGHIQPTQNKWNHIAIALAGHTQLILYFYIVVCILYECHMFLPDL